MELSQRKLSLFDTIAYHGIQLTNRGELRRGDTMRECEIKMNEERVRWSWCEEEKKREIWWYDVWRCQERSKVVATASDTARIEATTERQKSSDSYSVSTFCHCSQIENCFAPGIQFTKESSVVIWALGWNLKVFLSMLYATALKNKNCAASPPTPMTVQFTCESLFYQCLLYEHML